jgi:hypothetical protein
VALTASLIVSTALFEHLEVKPHFINPCCFGEDFAGWLRDRVRPTLPAAFALGDLIQEDYGWGFWATAAPKDTFWVALSYSGQGPVEGQAEWVITVAHDPGFHLLRRLFHRPDPDRFETLREAIWRVLRSTPEIVVTSEEPRH